MAVNNNYPYPNKNVALSVSFLNKLVACITNCINGKTNNTGEVSLDSNANETRVDNILCNQNSVVLLQAISNDAANLDTVWVEHMEQYFIIHHANMTSSEMKFKYVIVG